MSERKFIEFDRKYQKGTSSVQGFQFEPNIEYLGLFLLEIYNYIMCSGNPFLGMPIQKLIERDKQYQKAHL